MTHNPRRAVVTGGAVSRLQVHLWSALLDDGYRGCAGQLRHPGRRPRGATSPNGRVPLVRADVTNYVHVGDEVDAVLHLASPASPIDDRKLPVETLKVARSGRCTTLGLAREKGARFLCWRRRRRPTANRRCTRTGVVLGT